jgi:hypothetical protein
MLGGRELACVHAGYFAFAEHRARQKMDNIAKRLRLGLLCAKGCRSEGALAVLKPALWARFLHWPNGRKWWERTVSHRLEIYFS